MKSLRFLRKVSIRVRMCLFLATMLALECAVGFMHYNIVKSFDVPMMLLVLCVLVTLIGGLAVTASITAPINEFRVFMKKLKETLDFTLEYDVWSDLGHLVVGPYIVFKRKVQRLL